MSSLTISRADLTNTDHQRAYVELVNAYASEPIGQGQPLPAEVRERLVPALLAHPTTEILLAWHGEQAVGVCTCFLGFSTFTARPLLNVHDLYTRPEVRGQGVGRRLLAAAEARARELGCVKVTLEVLLSNGRAKAIYESVGYGGDDDRGQDGRYAFLYKRL